MSNAVVERRDRERGEPDEDDLRDRLERAGHRVARNVQPPGTAFPDHARGVDKIDAVVRGRFRVVLEGEVVILGRGDAVRVPRGAVHGAEVLGDEPVVSLDAVRRRGSRGRRGPARGRR